MYGKALSWMLKMAIASTRHYEERLQFIIKSVETECIGKEVNV